MKVNIDQLTEVTQLLLSRLRERAGNDIELSNDYYWDISSEQLYNPYAEPKDLTLGQLSFDIEKVQNLDPEHIISYDLKVVSEIFKALSNEVEIA